MGEETPDSENSKYKTHWGRLPLVLFGRHRKDQGGTDVMSEGKVG